MLKKELFGNFVRLTDTGFAFLNKIQYNSIVEVNGVDYILYGPLQFVNHSCESYLSLLDVPRGFSFRHEYEKDKYATPLIVKNEELLIKYVRKKALWFVCGCNKCSV